MTPNRTSRPVLSRRLNMFSRTRLRRWLSLLILLASTNLLAAGQSEEEIRAKFLYRSHTYEAPGGQVITRPYRLFVPDDYDPGTSFPLVVVFHGMGEVGDDNEIQIARHRLATAWADTVNQNRHPAFVVAAQTPASFSDPFYEGKNPWALTWTLLDSLLSEFSIDPDRIYATGLSMGGYATWMHILERPDIFAAAVPMSGAPDLIPADGITHVPIWALHGRVDAVTHAEQSRTWIRELQRLGVSPLYLECNLDGPCKTMSDCSRRGAVRHRRLIYTEYEFGPHDIWTRSYNDQVLIDWVFAQRRGQPTIGRVGPVVTIDVEASALTAAQTEPSVGIIGGKTPLDWQKPVPLCEEFDEGVFGGSIAFPDTTTGTLEYRFVQIDVTGENWIEEPRGEGVRRVTLNGGQQVLPMVFWGDENEQLPGSPVLTGPDRGSVTFRSTTLSWQPGGVGGRFEVQVDTSAGFESPFYSQSNLRQTTVSLSNLDTLTTYHWRVRGSNVVGSGEWSTADFFTVGLQTQLIEPQDNAMDQPQDVVLRWLPYPRATRYNLQVSENLDFAGAAVIRVDDVTQYRTQALVPGTRYYWRVRALNGWPSPTWSFVVSTATSISQDDDGLPTRCSLSRNYPNPFNPTTTISYDVSQSVHVTLTVVDVLGRQIRELASGTMSAGRYEVSFDASGLASGVYLYRLRAGDYVETKRMVVVR